MSSGPRIPPGKPGKFSTGDNQKHRRRSGRRIDESGEEWIIATRTIGGCGQLTASGKPVGHETLEKDRVEVGPGQVDGGGMSCGSGADDDLGEGVIRNRHASRMGEKTYDSGVQL